MKKIIFFSFLLVGLQSWGMTQSELNDYFERTLNVREQANTELEYENNLKTLANELSTDLADENDIFNFCFSLYTMPDEKLIGYYDLLSSPNLNGVSCQKPLLNRIEDNVMKLQPPPPAQSNLLPETETVLSDQKTPLTLPRDYRFAPKTIALTFDDGPHPKLTEKLLGILNQYKVKATFFMIGENSLAYPKIVQEVAAAGHTIGGHSMTHPELPKLPLTAALAQITGSLDAIKRALGVSEPFFRFPYGEGSTLLRNYLKQNDITEFIWNMDSLDWKTPNPTALLANALKEVRREQSGIILFHDIHPQTIAMMPTFLQSLAQNNYKLVYFESSKMVKPTIPVK